ncbi:hypothetical protein P8452_41718 [Trifolium repens]|nr:hypothetical protein P8452_41718 [Trifolium repens]
MVAWPCMVAATSAIPSLQKITQMKYFAQVLHDSYEVQVSQLPSPVIKGETFYHCNFANNSGATKQKKACILETLSSASLRLREPPSASFIARMAPKRRRFEPTPAADHPSHSAPAPTDEPTPATSHHVPPHPEARLSINDPANKSRKISQKYKSGCI